MDNNDLIQISLNQGKQFKKYQVFKSKRHNKIHNKVEGFTGQNDNTSDIFQERHDRIQSLNQLNQSDQSQLTNLDNQYNSVSSQYNAAENSINDSSLASINRT